LLRKPPKLGERQTVKARLTIFLSGVSQEFATFRDAVENEIEVKGGRS
jgi:hypothetical protein